MIRAGVAALWSHWQRNPLQLFTLVAGLALATALWSGVQAINSEARASYGAAAAILGEAQFDQLVAEDGGPIPLSTYVALRRAGWQVSPVLEGELPGTDGPIRLIGIDPLTAPAGLASADIAQSDDPQETLSQNILYAHPDGLPALADTPDLQLIPDARVPPRSALGDIAVVSRVLGDSNHVSRLILHEAQPKGLAPLATLVPDLTLNAASETEGVAQLTDSFHLNLTAFGLLSFAVGIFIVHGAIGLAFEQRRAMVRTLRALGMPLRTLVGLLALEIAVLAIGAGGLGVVLGYVIAAALLPDVAATLQGLYGADVSGSLQLRADWWLSGLAVALIGSGLAGLSALMRLIRMPILASPGARAWSMAHRHTGRLHGIAALLLLGVAALCTTYGQTLPLSFVSLGALLLGAALALPLLLDRALAVGQAMAQTVRWQWFWADTRQQLPGLSLALMALLLAASANVGVSTMVSSFRLTFIGFLDQRLSSDLYLRAEDAAQAAQLEALLLREADETLPLLQTDARLAGRPAELFGARVGDTYRDNWVFLASHPDVWSDLARGKAVIVNEQLARRAGLWLDDPLQITPTLTLPIAGVFGDYGNPIGQAIIGETLFTSLHSDIRPLRFGARTEDPEALARLLRDGLDLPEANITNQADLKAYSLDVFERTFSVTAALNVLTLAVAGFAILMSLLTLAAIRVPQLAPVWALGFTRQDLGRFELIRAVILATLTLLAALPLGLALAWILLAWVNVVAFGWLLPMSLFPLDYANLTCIAMGAALLAAAWPARKLARTPPAILLKVFAHER